MSSSFLVRKVYGIPLALAAITLLGLLLALYGDGAWDALSWIALAVPLSVIAWKCMLARGTAKSAARTAALTPTGSDD